VGTHTQKPLNKYNTHTALVII